MTSLSRKLKGYTLIEMVISIGVFLIVLSAITQIFGSSFGAYRSTRTLQHDLENGQYALNLMAKELRTSSVVSTDTTNGFRIAFFDYSQNACIQYVASETTGKLSKAYLPIAAGDPNAKRNACQSAIQAGFTTSTNLGNVVSGGISQAALSTVPSTPIVQSPFTPGVVGKVTIILTFGNSTKPATIQTTVSLRDFNYVGI